MLQNAMRNPYAPPTFHVIGEPSRQHMGRPVKLTYGTGLPYGYNPGPKVIWLDKKGRLAQATSEPNDAHPNVHYMK